VPLLTTGASVAVGALLVPVLTSVLRHVRLSRPNYRGRAAVFPTGLVLLGGSLGAVLTLSALAVLPPSLAAAVPLLVGVALLGLVDDLAPEAGPRGVRCHLRAAAAGRPSAGVVKGGGTFVLAVLACAQPALRGAGGALESVLLPAALVTLGAHVFNLIDLRPGRSIKALGLLGGALTVATLDFGPLISLASFLGPVAALAPLDLRERGMLGDTGSGLLGAMAGLWLVLALGAGAQLGALGLLILAATYGEFRSLSALVERVPLLRGLDSLGRI